MAAILFIGDELTAAGFRLAGATVRVPAPGEAAAALDAARREAELILIGADCAGSLPRAVLREALAAATPLVLVVSGVRELAPPPDPAARVRALLGLES